MTENRMVRVAVCGAHMSGLPLNSQLTSIGGRLVAKTTTSPSYRFYKLAGFIPPRPGLLRTGRGGTIELEVWELPVTEYGAFVAAIPAPLGIGTIELAEGTFVQGFLCEAYATEDAEDITHFGGWRGFLLASSGS
jgi:allophanate hydrolase